MTDVCRWGMSWRVPKRKPPVTATLAGRRLLDQGAVMRHFVLLAVLGMVVFSVAAQQDLPPDILIDRHMIRAERLLQEGDRAAARREVLRFSTSRTGTILICRPSPASSSRSWQLTSAWRKIAIENARRLPPGPWSRRRVLH